jgi:hypothetical protein
MDLSISCLCSLSIFPCSNSNSTKDINLNSQNIIYKPKLKFLLNRVEIIHKLSITETAVFFNFTVKHLKFPVKNGNICSRNC